MRFLFDSASPSSQRFARGQSGAEVGTAADEQTKAEELRQMDAVVERNKLWRAYERVLPSKGAAGVDGLTVFEFKQWLRQHWPSVKAALLAGQYMPAAIRKVEIAKPTGVVRTPGIPTVLDRLIQQALLQVLQPGFEPEFSEHSYGFRPGRNAWQAVLRAKSYIMDTTQTALPAMAAMEAPGHPKQAATSPRAGRDASMEVGKQPTRPLVERRS
jgi:hypothetical protein